MAVAEEPVLQQRGILREWKDVVMPGDRRPAPAKCCLRGLHV